MFVVAGNSKKFFSIKKKREENRIEIVPPLIIRLIFPETVTQLIDNCRGLTDRDATFRSLSIRSGIYRNTVYRNVARFFFEMKK